MGLTNPELFESDSSVIGTVLDQAKPGSQLRNTGESRHDLSSGYTCSAVQASRLSNTFWQNEMTGNRFVDAGLPFAPFPSSEGRPQGRELRLLSPASKWLMNSSFGNDPKIMKQLGADKAYMHPDEVKTRGLADDARVGLVIQPAR